MTDIPRKYLEESIGREQAELAAAGGITSGERISRAALGDETQELTSRDHGTPEQRFWGRQRGQAETIAIGKAYIQKVCRLDRL